MKTACRTGRVRAIERMERRLGVRRTGAACFFERETAFGRRPRLRFGSATAVVPLWASSLPACKSPPIVVDCLTNQACNRFAEVG